MELAILYPPPQFLLSSRGVFYSFSSHRSRGVFTGFFSDSCRGRGVFTPLVSAGWFLLPPRARASFELSGLLNSYPRFLLSRRGEFFLVDRSIVFCVSINFLFVTPSATSRPRRGGSVTHSPLSLTSYLLPSLLLSLLHKPPHYTILS